MKTFVKALLMLAVLAPMGAHSTPITSNSETDIRVEASRDIATGPYDGLGTLIDLGRPNTVAPQFEPALDEYRFSNFIARFVVQSNCSAIPSAGGAAVRNCTGTTDETTSVPEPGTLLLLGTGLLLLGGLRRKVAL